MVGPKLNEAKSELEPVQDIRFLGLRLCLDQGRANIQGSGDNSTCVPNILPEYPPFVVQRGVPVHGITQLGLRPHPTGWTHEALTMTFSFVTSGKLVYNHPTQAMAGPIVSHIRNPYPPFQGGVHDFHGRFYPGLGRPHGGFSEFVCLDPLKMQAPHQCAGAQGSNTGPSTLGLGITGLPGYYGLYLWVFFL